MSVVTNMIPRVQPYNPMSAVTNMIPKVQPMSTVKNMINPASNISNMYASNQPVTQYSSTSSKTPVPPTVFGPPMVVKTDFGLNPGYMQPVAQYQTTSPVQNQFYWGPAPFQAGSTFNSQLAKQGIGAPAQPWGLQQMYKPLTSNDLSNIVKQSTAIANQQVNPQAPKQTTTTTTTKVTTTKPAVVKR